MTDDRNVVDVIGSSLREVQAPMDRLLPGALRQGRVVKRRQAMQLAGGTLGALAAVSAVAFSSVGALGPDGNDETTASEPAHFAAIANGGLTVQEAIRVLDAVAPELAVARWDEDGEILTAESRYSWVALAGDSESNGTSGFELVVGYHERQDRPARCAQGEWARSSCETSRLADGTTIASWSSGDGGELITNNARMVRPDGVTISVSSKNYPTSHDGGDNQAPREATRTTALYTPDQLASLVAAPEWTTAVSS